MGTGAVHVWVFSPVLLFLKTIAVHLGHCLYARSLVSRLGWYR